MRSGGRKTGGWLVRFPHVLPRTRPRFRRSLFAERLEERTLLALVTWDGGGDGGSWDDANNWDTNTLPQPVDAVVIPDVAATTRVEHRTGSTSITSLVSNEQFVLSGGTLSVSGTLQVNNTFTINGGTLADATVLAGTGGQGLEFTSSSNNRLRGVAANLDLDLTDAADFVRILNGLTLNGTATLGPEAVLFSSGTQTLGGTGQVVFDTTTSGADPGRVRILPGDDVDTWAGADGAWPVWDVRAERQWYGGFGQSGGDLVGRRRQCNHRVGCTTLYQPGDRGG